MRRRAGSQEGDFGSLIVSQIEWKNRSPLKIGKLGAGFEKDGSGRGNVP